MIGGIVSLMIFVIMVLYGYIMLTIMLGMSRLLLVGRKDTNKGVNTTISNLFKDTEELSVKYI